MNWFIHWYTEIFIGNAQNLSTIPGKTDPYTTPNEFPAGPVVKKLSLPGPKFNSWSGTKMLQATQHGHSTRKAKHWAFWFPILWYFPLYLYFIKGSFFTYIFIHALLDLFQKSFFFFANASRIFKLHFKGGGGEAEEEGDINIHLADLRFCAAETNATLWSNYTPIKDK